MRCASIKGRRNTWCPFTFRISHTRYSHTLVTLRESGWELLRAQNPKCPKLKKETPHQTNKQAYCTRGKPLKITRKSPTEQASVHATSVQNRIRRSNSIRCSNSIHCLLMVVLFPFSAEVQPAGACERGGSGSAHSTVSPSGPLTNLILSLKFPSISSLHFFCI